MQFDNAESFLIRKLEEELPANITYHNVVHTKKVIQQAKKLSETLSIEGDDEIILLTAALFHDSGFLITYNEHEKASCELARKYLPNYDYSKEQIEQVCKLIHVTRIPHLPKTTLEKILCDADLYYLGTDAYDTNAEKLFNELKAHGIVKNRSEWRKRQIAFLRSHRYFTEPAIQHLSKAKESKLHQLQHPEKSIKVDAMKQTLLSIFHDWFLICLGVITAGFALKGFLVPNHFFDGGVTGVSLLLHELYHFNLAATIVVANLPLIVVSYFAVSNKFAFKTFISVLLLGLCLLYIPYPTITSDNLLISIFGGFFLGVGIGLTMRAGCALDGVEVLALYTRKFSNFTITEIILGINIIIFTFAAFAFGLETALYSVLTYFTASKAIDYVVEGIEAYTGVTIISGESDTIKHRLVNELGRGITVYKGERGFLPGNYEVSTDCDIIFTVVTRMELRKLKNVVYETDAKAFVFANTIREASGGLVKQRHHH
jgi:uncharacterized membrane-anchored protein YitT (DUF2179 family)/HD superfamily phosphodiesterase